MNVLTSPSSIVLSQEQIQTILSRLTESELDLWGKIEEILKVYPKISPTMLQVSLGTAISAEMWKPVCEKMILCGYVTRTEYPPFGGTRRTRNFVALSLVEKPIAIPSSPPDVPDTLGEAEFDMDPATLCA